jgi:phospholipid/cholesterol/gamma-HCH transport system permease protein
VLGPSGTGKSVTIRHVNGLEKPDQGDIKVFGQSIVNLGEEELSPIRRLVLPRVLAVFIMLPILTAIADVLGIVGGLLIAVVDLQMTPQDYLNSIWNSLRIDDIASGLAKTFFFGLEVALIGCYNGLQVEGGATSVGSATTRTVVFASISILISDFFLTKLFLAL